MPSLHPLDLITIAGYLIITLLIGLSVAKRKETSEDYFLAGRRLTWPILGASLFSTNISAEHLVGLAGEAHRVGLVVGGFEWVACFCLLTLAFVFVPQYLKNRIFTIPEFLERRFSLAARMVLSGYFLVMIVLTKISIALWAGALVVNTLFGWDIQMVMWSIGIFTALYTAAGGLAAVVYTDAFQTVIFVLGSAFLTMVALAKAGGWSGVASRVPEGFLHMVKPVTHPDYPITGFIFGNYFGGMFYWCMDQVIVQRVLGARDIEEGKKGAIFAGFLKILPVFIFVLPGAIAAALYPHISHDAAYPTLVSQLVPVGLRGLILAGLLAALMSSLSSISNSAATLVAHDFVVRFSKTPPGQETQIWIGRATTAVVMAAGILWAPVIGQAETLWKYLQVVSAYMGLPMAAALLTGVLWKRATNAGALAAMSFGVLLGGLMLLDSIMASQGGLIPLLQTPIMASFMHRSFLAFLASIAVMVWVSLYTKPPRRDQVEGVCFAWASAQTASNSVLGSSKLWGGALAATSLFCWVLFA
ncbi:MAG: sodium/solute symporter [Acidimicrobiia bacterium]|nr:sodium/solute symporter [Acidimicrobiia bacterium]